MYSNKIFSAEEFFIQKLLFGDKEISSEEIKEIDFDKLIKVSSYHLLIPALYWNCKKKKYLKYFPEDFNNYIKEIHKINYERNCQLLTEMKELAKLFNNSKIKHVFIKGSSLIANKTLDDMGSRMIGDIDILVDEKDLIKSVNSIQKEGYYSLENSFFEERHYTRQISKSKLFAVELHKFVLRGDSKFLKTDKILKNSKAVNDNIYIPSKKHQQLINIYNFQINDYGYINFNYSYKSMYDHKSIISSQNNEKYLNNDKYFNRYIKIYDFIILEKFDKNFKSGRKFLNLKIKYKVVGKVYSLIVNVLMINRNFIRIKEFFYNRKYRKYLFGKIKKAFWVNL